MTLSGCYLNDIAKNQRGAMLQSSITTKGNLNVIGGNNIDRFGIRSIKGNLITNTDNKATIESNSVLVQNIVAHIENPIDHIKIIACVPNELDYLILDTINQIVISEPYNKYYVWCLLNSNLINWYLYRFVYGKAIRTMHFDNTVTMKLPVIEVSEDEQKPFIEKADLMLAQNKNLHQQQTTFLNFIQAELNPQKISTKLQHYYQLNWDEFKTELKKSKVDLAKLTLSEREQWLEKFETEKQKALAIKTIIEQTDHEIDEMVYKLYNLSPDDINIISEYNKK